MKYINCESQNLRVQGDHEIDDIYNFGAEINHGEEALLQICYHSF